MWMIITTESVYTPGDERSRTHPGHGYPESYDNVDRVQQFTDDQYDKFKDKISQLARYNTPYKAYKCEELTVKHSIEIEIK